MLIRLFFLIPMYQFIHSDRQKYIRFFKKPRLLVQIFLRFTSEAGKVTFYSINSGATLTAQAAGIKDYGRIPSGPNRHSHKGSPSRSALTRRSTGGVPPPRPWKLRLICRDASLLIVKIFRLPRRFSVVSINLDSLTGGFAKDQGILARSPAFFGTKNLKYLRRPIAGHLERQE